MRREFDLHPLAVEDAIHAHQRPKLEVYDDMLFIVLKTARYVDPTEVIELGEILIFLGDDYIITVRHGEASALERRAARAREATPSMLRHGPGAVLHAIVDRVVDDYAPAIDGPRRRTSTRSRTEVFSAGRSQRRRSASTSCKREVLQFLHGHRDRSWIRSTASRDGKYAHDPPRDARPTSATSTTTCCGRTTSSTAIRDLLTQHRSRPT